MGTYIKWVPNISKGLLSLVTDNGWEPYKSKIDFCVVFSSSLSPQPAIVASSLASLTSQVPTSRNLGLVSIRVFCANRSSHFSFRFNLGYTSYLGIEVETGTDWTCGFSVAFHSANLCGSYPFGLSVLFVRDSLLY